MKTAIGNIIRDSGGWVVGFIDDPCKVKLVYKDADGNEIVVNARNWDTMFNKVAKAFGVEPMKYHGGKRVGAGRPKGTRRQVAFWVNEEEAEFLKTKLKEYRNE